MRTFLTTQRLTLLSFALLLAAPLAGQTHDICAEASVLLSGIDASGAALANLQPTDFHAEVKGHIVPITSMLAYRGPKRVLILIDASRRMTKEPRSGPWQLIGMLTKDAIHNASPKTSLAIAFYATGDVAGYSGFLSDRNQLIAQFDGVNTEQMFAGRKYNSQLFDALQWALNTLAPAQAGDSIYLLTGGEESRSRASLAEVRQNLLHSGVRLFSYLLPAARPPLPPGSVLHDIVGTSPHIGLFEPLAVYTPVLELARDSGGNIAVEAATRNGFVNPSPVGLKLIEFSEDTLFRQMQTALRIEVTLPPEMIPSRSKPLPLLIVPTVAPGQAHRGWVMNYPKLIPACPAPAADLN